MACKLDAPSLVCVRCLRFPAFCKTCAVAVSNPKLYMSVSLRIQPLAERSYALLIFFVICTMIVTSRVTWVHSGEIKG